MAATAAVVTGIYRNVQGAVALATSRPAGGTTISWPTMRKGQGLADAVWHHRERGTQETAADDGTMRLSHRAPYWNYDSPPLDMEEVGRLEGDTLKLDGRRLSVSQREYFGIPWPWTGNGPDTVVALTPSGRQGAGLAEMANFQELRSRRGLTKEQQPTTADGEIATLRTSNLWINLKELGDAEADYLGVQTANAASDSTEATEGEADSETIIRVRRQGGRVTMTLEGPIDREATEAAGARLIRAYRQDAETPLDRFLEDAGMRLAMETHGNGRVSVSVRPHAYHKVSKEDGILQRARRHRATPSPRPNGT